MLSVGIFSYSTRPRGSVVHATHLAEALARRGHAVTLYALSKAGDRLYRDVACELVLLPAGPAPTDPDALIRQRIAEVATGVSALRPRHDVYHAEDCLVSSGLLEASGGLELRPLVRTLHHLEHFESPYLRACQRRSILEADAVACVSRVSQRDVLRELGRRAPIIGNGVDLERFAAPDSAALEQQRLRLAPAGGRIVLSVGGVEPRKNSLTTLQAMAALLARQPDLHWVVAGGASIWEHDAYRQQFEALRSALPLGVQRRIVQLGPVSEQELTALYGAAQLLLCPSLQEGFGLCVLEALASRVPVVVSSGEPFSEYLDDGCASFVAPSSAVAIADAVERLLGDEPLRAARVAAGHERVRQFTWERVAIEHERLYGELAGSLGRNQALAPAWRAPVSEESSHA
ncbi:MAG TPA: MSMEG_0565 family glycosyltransferase [Polyangiaceae bacterium]